MRKLTLLLTLLLIISYLKGQVILNYGDAEIINGGLGVGNSTSTKNGTIRWNGTNFQGFNGVSWVDLDKQGSPVGLIGDVQFAKGDGTFTNSDGVSSGTTFNFDGDNFYIDFASGNYMYTTPDNTYHELYMESTTANSGILFRDKEFIFSYYSNSGDNDAWFEMNAGRGTGTDAGLEMNVINGIHWYENDVTLNNNRRLFFKLQNQNDNTTIDKIELDTTKLSIAFNNEERYSFNENDEFKFKDKFIRFNEDVGMFEFATGKGDVIWQGALEDLVQVYNATPDTIPDFKPVYFNGVYNEQLPTINYAVSSVTQKSINVEGITTVAIPPNEWGYICERGYVNNVNTSNLTITRPGFLGDSIVTDSMPPYPNRAIILGAPIKIDGDSGVFYVEISNALEREFISGAEGFTSQGIGAGTFYTYGFYDAPTTSTTRTQASPTITYGVANRAHMSHPFAVAGGAGTVTGGGRVALITTGTGFDDFCVRTPSLVDTLISDITTVSLNEYFETTKYNGTVTYSLVVAEGAPTAYSFTFNYGFAKYDDSFNRDFYVVGIETVGVAAANDADFNIELLHHRTTGWTYATTGFIPGDGALASFSDMAPEDNLVNNKPFAWKCVALGNYINGAGTEGLILRITTGANNSVQNMNTKIVIAVDRIAGFSTPN